MGEYSATGVPLFLGRGVGRVFLRFARCCVTPCNSFLGRSHTAVREKIMAFSKTETNIDFMASAKIGAIGLEEMVIAITNL